MGETSIIAEIRIAGILRKYTTMTYDDYLAATSPSWLHYHNIHHIAEMVNNAFVGGRPSDSLLLAIVFHDFGYDPKSPNNEARAISALHNFAKHPNSKIVKDVCSAIINTSYSFLDKRKLDKLSRTLIRLDLQIFGASKIDQMAMEENIFREYSWVPIKTFREKRIQALQQIHVKTGIDTTWNVSYVKSTNRKIAFYPGSFNPFHKGHLDVLNKAEPLFDKIVILKAKAGNKESARWSWPLSTTLEPYERNDVDTELAKWIRNYIAGTKDKYYIIRGFRNTSDIQHELNLQKAIHDVVNVEFAYFNCSPHFEHISSSMIRELSAVNGDYERYIV